MNIDYKELSNQGQKLNSRLENQQQPTSGDLETVKEWIAKTDEALKQFNSALNAMNPTYKIKDRYSS